MLAVLQLGHLCQTRCTVRTRLRALLQPGRQDRPLKKRLRPDVRIHVSVAEVAFWGAPDFTFTSMPEPVPKVLRTTATQFLKDYGDNLQIFDAEHEVATSVVAKLTSGHTPGHCVVHVTSGIERLTFAATPCSP